MADSTHGKGPAPARVESLVSAGETLHLEHFDPPRPGPPRGLLVAVHGFSAHCGLYRHVAAALAADGLSLTTFDCRGHGRSTGRRGYAARFRLFVEDLCLVVDRARERVGQGVPLYLLGHSHGATVCLEAVLTGAIRPDRLILATPYLDLRMKVPAWKRAISGITSRVWPTLTLGNGIQAETVSRNPEVIANFWKDPLAHHVATPRWFVEVGAAQQRIRAAAADLDVPTLLLLAGEDRLVVNDVALALAAAAPAFVDVRRFEGLYHEIFLEPEWPAVVEEMRTWLARPRAPEADRHDHERSAKSTAPLTAGGDAPPKVPAILSPRS